MEQIYAIAQGFEMNHTGMAPYMGIAPLTNRNNKSTIRRRNMYSNNIETRKIETELSNMSLFEQHQSEANNITGTFSGAERKNGHGFGGTFKTNTRCFNCGDEGHWMATCPNKTKRKNTKAMTRSQSKEKKGRERTRGRYGKKRNKNEWYSSDIKPLSPGLSPRLKAIGRSRKNRNYQSRKRYSQTIECDNSDDSYDDDDDYNDYGYNNDYESDESDRQIQNVETYNHESHDENYFSEDQYDERIYDNYDYETEESKDGQWSYAVLRGPVLAGPVFVEPDRGPWRVGPN